MAKKIKLSIYVSIFLLLLCLVGEAAAKPTKSRLAKVYSTQKLGFVFDSAIKGNYAYVVGKDGMAVLDIKSPHKPRTIKVFKSDSPLNDIFIDGNYAFVTSGIRRALDGKVRIFDISNPLKIREIPNNLILPESPIGIIVKDGIGYIGDYGSGLFIVDFSNLHSPKILSRFPESPNVDESKIAKATAAANKNPKKFMNKVGSKFGLKDKADAKEWIKIFGVKGHVWWPYLKYPYILMPYDSEGMYILNISDPRHPAQLGYFNKKAPNGKDYYFNDISLSGKYAFISLDYAGLLVLDLSDPKNPIEITHVNPWEGEKWSEAPGHMVQIETDGNTAYVTAGEDGLYIYDISDPKNPRIVQKFPKSVDSGKGNAWGLFVNDSFVTVGYAPGKAKKIKGAFEIFSR